MLLSTAWMRLSRAIFRRWFLRYRNWPIWLPIDAKTSSNSGSGWRDPGPKKSITPVI